MAKLNYVHHIRTIIIINIYKYYNLNLTNIFKMSENP